MKYLKLYEKWNQKLAEELVNDLSQSTIEEYYDEHYGHDVEEIVGLYPSIVWDHIDDKRFVQDYIDNISNQSIEDLKDESDFRNFITDNWSEKKEDKILQIWKSKQHNKEMKD